MKKFVFSFIFGIFLISLVSASSYNIEFNQVDNKVLVTHIIHLDSNKTILINIPSDAYSISSNSNYSIQDNYLIMTGRDIKLSYLVKSFLEKSKDGYYFVDRVMFNFPVNETTITLILKEGYFTENDKIFPSPSSIYSDGSQIYISWNISDIKSGDDFPIFVSIKSPTGFSLLWMFLIFLILIIIYLIYTKIKTSSQKNPHIESHLLESEKTILKILKESDRGEIWQKQLQLKTGYSKAKLSRLIRNLESRNLVEKIPFGNTNKIRLK